MELTTVADDEAVVHDGMDVRVYDGLEPDTAYEYDGFAFRTLPHPGGELLCRFATVNDVHFGEVECGIIEGSDIGPTFRTEPGDDPYPEVMNRGAIAEMQEQDFAAVLVKGDLTSNGTVAEYDRFRSFYEPAFGDRLHVVRGNHESYNHATYAMDVPVTVELPGVTVVIIDTSIDGSPTGQVDAETRAYVAEVASSTAVADPGRSVLLFGHHHIWNPESTERPDHYFGVHPDDSELFVELVGEHQNIRGYFAGHTHRNRVRRFSVSRDVPWVEVASVKEFPGAWAEYRVFEGGVLQIMRRISSAECLAWTEKTRQMYAGLYFDYSFGLLSDRCFAMPGPPA
jgi:Icc protein